MSDQIERHTLHYVDEELKTLHTLISKMSELVFSQLCQSLESLKKVDPDLAEQVIYREREVNKLEVTADSEIITILARFSPVAGDLRYVMAASKIINDLERIGDEAAKIANFVLFLHTDSDQNPATYPLDDVYAVGDLAITTLHHALQTVAESDGAKAKAIIHDHKALDDQFKAGVHRLMNGPQPKNDYQVSHSVRVVLMLNALERVGDHAQNIAESVIFQVTGEDVRHRFPDYYDQKYPLANQKGECESSKDQ
jgi:phosphate transport system protein